MPQSLSAVLLNSFLETLFAKDPSTAVQAFEEALVLQTSIERKNQSSHNSEVLGQVAPGGQSKPSKQE
jgi:hypothetical protein